MSMMRTGRNPLAQALFACAVICLLAVQSFAGVNVHNAAFEEPGAVSQAMDAIPTGVVCNRIADHQAPAHDRHDMTQCCTFCSDQSEDASFLAVVAVARIIAILTPDGDARQPIYDQPRSTLPLSGWKSAWSSTAPPRA